MIREGGKFCAFHGFCDEVSSLSCLGLFSGVLGIFGSSSGASVVATRGGNSVGWSGVFGGSCSLVVCHGLLGRIAFLRWLLELKVNRS